MRRYIGLFSCIVLSLSLQAQPAATIKIGMSAPFTGRAERLGLDYRFGAQLALNQLNQNGGIAGRQLELLTLDDGYEPHRTVNNTRQLVFNDKVLALFGYIGTPTSNAILPLLRHEQVPFIAPFSGADLLRQPADHFIYNFRASYAQEASAQIDYLVDQRHFKNFGLLIQADEFGASLERNFLAELKKRQLTPLVISRFKRNTSDLADAVATLMAKKPDVVLTVGTYQVLIDAIRLGAKQQFNPLYSVVSFTGVSELSMLLDNSNQVLASMVMPNPTTSQLALVKDYRQQVQAHASTSVATLTSKGLSDVALEGYAAGMVLVGALKQCAATITRDCLRQALPQQKLADFVLNYDAKRHQASQHVSLVWLKNQSLQPIKPLASEHN
jgi:branched-chain amino acid transport system substrate-binding protein